jgi:hypothetical protein
MVIPDMVSVAVPVLVTTTTFGFDVVPTCCVGKTMLATERDTNGAGVNPVP